MKACPYQQYYTNQAGGGVGAIYRGSPYQRGCGLGSFFGGVFRSILPLIKSGLKTLGLELFKTGTSVMSDLKANVPFRESFTNRISAAGTSLKRKAVDKINELTGDGYKRRRPSMTKSVKRLKEKSRNRSLLLRKDIFTKI